MVWQPPEHILQPHHHKRHFTAKRESEKWIKQAALWIILTSVCQVTERVLTLDGHDVHVTLLQWKHTCGCAPSPPCGSCSGCSGLCSSRSESPASRPSDLACACERACSSASRSHSVPSSPLQNRRARISFNTHKANMCLNATCKRLEVRWKRKVYLPSTIPQG